MRTLESRLSSRRAQHLVFLLHVWACAPFLFFWSRDLHTQRVLGPESIEALQPVIGLAVVYLVVRTWVAWRDFEGLAWQYVFPPVDVGLISLILFLSHRGPASNIALLFFLPMVQASGSLNVRWASAVGVMVVIGTAISTLGATDIPSEHVPRTARALLQNDPLNSTFRIYFLIVLSSLMAYQSLIAAGLKERLGVAADRNRIAIDMHDGVQGHLITLASQLELLERVAPKEPERAAALAGESRETARKAADELRFLVQRMRSPSLSQGFVGALTQFAHNLCDRHGIALEFLVIGDQISLPPETENALFRIAQEALTNVVKHARAARVWVRIAYAAPDVLMEIWDDGQGIDAGAGGGNGIGLVSIRERAERAGGSVTLGRGEGEGLRVTTRLPIA